MRFKKHYFKEIYSQWEYKVQDPYTAIYDFYAMSLIDPLFIKDENLSYAFKEAKKKIIEYEKDFLLNEIIKGICSEIIYYLHFRKLEALENYVPPYLKSNISKKIFKDYVTFFGLYDGKPKLDYNGKLILKTLSHGHNYELIYNMTLDFMKKYGYDIKDFLIFANEAFGDITGWKSDQYGGKAWIVITKVGFDLLNLDVNDFNKAMAIIDHAFDLQHNTGSILSKNNTLDKLRIKDILDDKRYIKNVMTYYNKISSNLRSPFAAAVKDIYGKTVESERSQIELEDMINQVTKNPISIKFIKNPPIEVQKAALEQDYNVINLIDNPDIKLVKEVILKDPSVFETLSPNIKNKLPKSFVEKIFGSFKQLQLKKEPELDDLDLKFKEI